MSEVQASPAPVDAESRPAPLNHPAALLIVLVAGTGLALSARSGALPLLIVVAVVQAALTLSWVFGAALPGRIGAVVIAALAAAGADVTTSIWPHGRLGTLLVVFALAVPVLFAHQLVRGAARARIVESIGGCALLLVGVVGLAALLQLRHEFGAVLGGKVVAGVVVAAAGALVVGHLVDLIVAAPRFDPAVARGLLAVIASAGLGGSVGHLMLRSQTEFAGGRGAFTGAALGALVAFLAVGVAFIDAAPTVARAGFGRRIRPGYLALLPLAILAPVAFLLCLAIRA